MVGHPESMIEPDSQRWHLLQGYSDSSNVENFRPEGTVLSEIIIDWEPVWYRLWWSSSQGRPQGEGGWRVDVSLEGQWNIWHQSTKIGYSLYPLSCTISEKDPLYLALSYSLSHVVLFVCQFYWTILNWNYWDHKHPCHIMASQWILIKWMNNKLMNK